MPHQDENMSTYAADLESIQAAARRIEGGVHRTPVLQCSALNSMANKALFFKCENLQKVGASFELEFEAQGGIRQGALFLL